jgi:hypothetical protein
MTLTAFGSEQLRLSDKTVNGVILSSLVLANGRWGTLRGSFGEELHSACMTAIISGPRYGSTVGSSLVISANYSVRATRLDHAHESNTRRPSQYSLSERRKLGTPQGSPNKNPHDVFATQEYLSKLRVIPSEHDNATLRAVRERWQVPPGLFVVCSEPQIPNEVSGHDFVNSPAPGNSKQRHPHCF